MVAEWHPAISREHARKRRSRLCSGCVAVIPARRHRFRGLLRSRFASSVHAANASPISKIESTRPCHSSSQQVSYLSLSQDNSHNPVTSHSYTIAVALAFDRAFGVDSMTWWSVVQQHRAESSRHLAASTLAHGCASHRPSVRRSQA